MSYYHYTKGCHLQNIVKDGIIKTTKNGCEKKTLIESIAEKNKLFHQIREERLRNYHDANGKRVSGWNNDETSQHYKEDVEKAFGKINMNAINTIVEFMGHAHYQENYQKIKLNKIYKQLRNLDKDYGDCEISKRNVKYNLLKDKEKLNTDYCSIYQYRI
jgi:hypothetical protein